MNAQRAITELIDARRRSHDTTVVFVSHAYLRRGRSRGSRGGDHAGGEVDVRAAESGHGEHRHQGLRHFVLLHQSAQGRPGRERPLGLLRVRLSAVGRIQPTSNDQAPLNAPFAMSPTAPSVVFLLVPKRGSWRPDEVIDLHADDRPARAAWPPRSAGTGWWRTPRTTSKCHGLLVIALTDDRGRLLWVSAARPGRTSEITACRHDRIPRGRRGCPPGQHPDPHPQAHRHGEPEELRRSGTGQGGRRAPPSCGRSASGPSPTWASSASTTATPKPTRP